MASGSAFVPSAPALCVGGSMIEERFSKGGGEVYSAAVGSRILLRADAHGSRIEIFLWWSDFRCT